MITPGQLRDMAQATMDLDQDGIDHWANVMNEVQLRTASEIGVTIVKLLDMITNRTSCTKCGRTIWFVRMKTGKVNPITADGTSHFSDCPHAKEFHRV